MKMFLIGAIFFSLASKAISLRQNLTFGQSYPLTSPYQQEAIDFNTGIRTAFAEINRAKTLAQDLQLIALDDYFNATIALQNAQTLVSQKNVFALCGFYGTTAATTVAQYIMNTSIPLIGTFSGSTLIRSPFVPNIVNIRPSYQDEAAAIVKFLVTEKLLSQIAIVYENDSYGISGRDSLAAVMQTLGLQLIAAASYPSGTTQVQGAVDIISKANPQAVVLMAQFSPGAAFVNLYRNKIGFQTNTLFMAPSVIGAELFLASLNPPWSNIYLTQVFPAVTDTTSYLVNNYTNSLKVYNNSAVPSSISLEGYVLGRFIGNALARMEGNLTRAKFLDVVYLSSIFRIDDLRLGPYFYSLNYYPFPLPSEAVGCNQGIRNIIITSFNVSLNLWEEASTPLEFYGTCNIEFNQILTPVVFASVCSNPSRCFLFQRGIQTAFESNNVERGLPGLTLRSLSVTIPPGSTLSSIVNSVPWYNNIIGYLGNEGDINSNSAFIQQEIQRGKVILGPMSGDLSLRNPFNPNIINLRASIIDEIYAIITKLLLEYNFSKITLVTDGSSQGFQAHSIFASQMTLYGLDPNNQFFMTTSYSSANSLFQDVYPQSNPPQVVVLVGATTAISPISQLLSATIVKRVFTSLNSLQDIYNISLGNPNNLILSSPTPAFTNSTKDIISNSYYNDYQALFSSMDSYFTDPIVFEGYIVGTFVASVISRVTSNITGNGIINQVMNIRSFDVEGLKLGPFSNLNCSGNTADVYFGCQCNQGMRSVYLYNVAVVANRSFFNPISEDTFQFDSCGVIISGANLQWDDLSKMSNLALVSALLILAGVTLIAIVFVLRYRAHAVIVASSPLFMILILIGIFTGYLSILPFIGEPTLGKCYLQPWVAGLAWIIVLGYFLLMLWSFIESPQVRIDPVAKWKYCDGNNSMRIVLIVYNVAVVLITTVLSVKTRNAYEKYSDAKVMGLTSYNLFFMGVILFGLILQSQYQQKFVLTCCMILLLNTPTLFFVFGVKLYYILAAVSLQSARATPSSKSHSISVVNPKTGGSRNDLNVGTKNELNPGSKNDLNGGSKDERKVKNGAAFGEGSTTLSMKF